MIDINHFRSLLKEHFLIITVILIILLLLTIQYQSVKCSKPSVSMFTLFQEQFSKLTESFQNQKEQLPKIPYYLCIMAIFKNEQTYMQEWLDHHVKQGVQHFYLYSNDPKMENYRFLKDLKYQGYLTVIPWVNKQNHGAETIQRQAYTHCIQTYNDQYQYLMMLDIDEFLCPTGNKKQNVLTVLQRITVQNSNKIKALKIPRFNYGSDGHIHRPKGNVMNNYFNHEKICSSYKTIANSKYIDNSKKFYGVHDFPLKNDINDQNQGLIINPYFTYEKTGFPNGCSTNDVNQVPLIIKHYYTKSYDEYMQRCQLWTNGGVNNIGYRTNCDTTFKERAFF